MYTQPSRSISSRVAVGSMAPGKMAPPPRRFSPQSAHICLGNASFADRSMARLATSQAATTSNVKLGRKPARTKSGRKPKSGSAVEPSGANAKMILDKLLERGTMKLQSAEDTIATRSEVIRMLTTISLDAKPTGRIVLAFPSIKSDVAEQAAVKSSKAGSLLNLDLAVLPVPEGNGGGAVLVAEAEAAPAHLAIEAGEEIFTLSGQANPERVAFGLFRRLEMSTTTTVIATVSLRSSLRTSLNIFLSAVSLLRNQLQKGSLDCGFSTKLTTIKSTTQ
eukprot:gene14173-20140_t